MASIESKLFVDTLRMPPYAMNAFDLVRIMREELESKYVRENILKWLDLIFGVDQRKPEKYNLFFPAAYPDYHKDNRIDRVFEDEEYTEQELAEVKRNMIYNMNDMCIVPPKLFSSQLEQVV